MKGSLMKSLLTLVLTLFASNALANGWTCEVHFEDSAKEEIEIDLPDYKASGKAYTEEKVATWTYGEDTYTAELTQSDVTGLKVTAHDKDKKRLDYFAASTASLKDGKRFLQLIISTGKKGGVNIHCRQD
jgi:hypothetical protein